MDVYEHEAALYFKDLSDTVLADDDFLQLQGFPNVLITPHIAFCTNGKLVRRSCRRPRALRVLTALPSPALSRGVDRDLVDDQVESGRLLCHRQARRAAAESAAVSRSARPCPRSVPSAERKWCARVSVARGCAMGTCHCAATVWVRWPRSWAGKSRGTALAGVPVEWSRLPSARSG
jgi:hypothetical protein